MSEAILEPWFKPPKKWKSWRVCPRCGGRQTKLWDLNTGLYCCQICEHQYESPQRALKEQP
jgi:hypothetical protein